MATADGSTAVPAQPSLSSPCRRPWFVGFLAALMFALVGYADAQVRSRVFLDQPDDASGYQVHVLYVLPSDGVDDGLDLNGTIATSVAACQQWFAGQMGGRQLRFDTYQGAPDITFFRMSRTDAQIRGYGASVRGQIEHELLGAGFNLPNKVYAVYYGGGNDVSCGSAAWPPIIPGHVCALYLRGTPPDRSPCSSAPITSAISAPGYWEFGLGQVILNVLGFVPTTSPHFWGAHVLDDPRDLMYAGPLPWQPAVLDAGHDDYFEHGIWGVLDLAQSAFIEPLPAYPVLPPSWPLVDLRALDSSLESSMRSKESRTSSGIEFVNASQEVRRVYWLDYGGGRRLYAILAPWQSYVQQSYLTQPWIVTNSADEGMEIFLPVDKQATAVMRRRSRTGIPAAAP
jgi:hypothetical protein